MKTGKKIALLLGVAAGVMALAMVFGRTKKKPKNLVVKKETHTNGVKKSVKEVESDFNYV
jgi:hypothetical protein